MNAVVIGKRTTIGAALTSVALVLGKFWPEYLDTFVEASIPVTFIVQVWIAHQFGVTTKEDPNENP